LTAGEREALSYAVKKAFEHSGWRSKEAAYPRCRITRVDVPGDTSRRWIITVPALGDAPERQVFAKHYSLASKFRQDVANEFRGLQITYGAFRSSERFKVPEPYWFDEDRRVILMEYCPSVTLSRRLFHRVRWSRFLSFSGHQRKAFHDFAQAGSLLAQFQAIPASLVQTLQREREPAADDILFRYKETFLRNLEACKTAGLSRVLLDRVRDYVCERLQIQARIEIVVQHSDFGPWNLLRGRKYLYLVDFHNFTIGLRTHDVAYFHAALDSWNRFWTVDESTLREAKGLFLSAFLGEGACGAVPDRTGIEALPLFRELRIVHMAYFARIALSRRRSVRELAYAPIPCRRFFRQWFERETAG
jgi:phosphotransferase family enzyme